MASKPVEVTFDGHAERVGGKLIVRLPAEASAAMPSRGQVAAEVVFSAKPSDISDRAQSQNDHLLTVIEPDGMKGHWLPLDLFRVASHTNEGDPVSIHLTTTKDWPEPDIPHDLAEALSSAPDLEETWSDITPMARWEWVRWVRATKNPDTRARRVHVTIDKLRNGKRRPCCFDLSSCTDPDLAKSGKLISPTSAL